VGQQLLKINQGRVGSESSQSGRKDGVKKNTNKAVQKLSK
jgi:hypothetical protein